MHLPAFNYSMCMSWFIRPCVVWLHAHRVCSHLLGSSHNILNASLIKFISLVLFRKPSKSDKTFSFSINSIWNTFYRRAIRCRIIPSEYSLGTINRQMNPLWFDRVSIVLVFCSYSIHLMWATTDKHSSKGQITEQFSWMPFLAFNTRFLLRW